ncbi:MAG TPA: 3-hydroxyacyl-CoA dehydrogenase, partial [Planctomycetaceae bacterium]|nr:3-hydroxyacyl-CoA dehydrogenase [Planctomycetaceae bacterium]
GLHFFNPAHRMPLVEVIHREATTPKALATALALVRRLRKTPVLVKNREGFLVNRVFIPYLKEAFWLLEEGADPRTIDRAAVDFGFPMGPLALIDMAGLDILKATDRVLRRAFPWHRPECVLVERLVEAGHLGQKTGAGVYKYQPGDYTPQDHAAMADLLRDVRQKGQRAARPIDSGEITDRLVLRMVAEAFRVLEDAVVQRESDMDVAMVLGVGFPDFRGGLVRYARDRGLDRIVDRLKTLAERYGERFAPNKLLRQLSGTSGRRSGKD